MGTARLDGDQVKPFALSDEAVDTEGSSPSGTGGAAWRAIGTTWLGRPFVRHVGILTVSNVAGAGLNVILGVLVARWLGPALFGSSALVMTYPGLLYSILDARSSEASVKYLGEFQSRGDRGRALAMCRLGYLVDLCVAVGACAFVALTAGWAAARIVHHPEFSGLMVGYTLALVPASLAGTSTAVLVTFRRFRTVAWIEAATTVVRFCVVLWLVTAGWQVAGVVWGNAIAMGTNGLLYGLASALVSRREWGGVLNDGSGATLAGRRREVLGFLAFSSVHATLGMVSKQLDVAILGFFRGVTEVGYYRIAKSIAGLVSLLIGPLQTVSYPALIRVWASNGAQALKRSVWKLTLLVGVPLALATAVAALLVGDALALLVGAAYLPAVFTARVLLLNAGWQVMFFWLRPAYMATGRLGSYVLASSVASAGLILAWMVAVPPLGHVGTAVALLAQTVGLTVYCGWWLRRLPDGSVLRDQLPLGAS
jgi:O-antigen/teichoic acid export membrane protein